MSAPLRLDLDGDALVANWRWLAGRQPGAACGAAIKADGYGLGGRAVMERLARAGCRDFFVATWAEAETLGALPDGVALSVLHGVRAADMPVARAHAARAVLNSVAQVRRWRESGGGACDVMVDTGMNRLGLTPGEAMSGLLDGLVIETLMSHLACADEPKHALNRAQRDAFAAVAARIPARRYSFANSAGILLGQGYGFDLTRPGLGLYGGTPGPGAEGALRQVVHLMTEVLQVRDVPAGQSVGYGATWRAERDSRIAIVNCGYADGFLRALGAAGLGRAGDAILPIVGRISMDLIALDATGASVGEGDEIEMGFDLPRLSAASGLSQYELLTGLGRRFERRWA